MVAWSAFEAAPVITLRGERLALAIVKRAKRVENRHFHIRGWCWIHAGLSPTKAEHAAVVDSMTDVAPETPDLRGFIIGAAHFSHTLTLEEAKADTSMAPWAFGPLCNIVDDAFMLEKPVKMRGGLGPRKVSPEVKQQLHQQLLAEGIVA